MTKYVLILLMVVAMFCSCSKDSEPCLEKTWYSDSDDDGYGDKENSITSCEKPNAYVENDLDCDDTNDQIHPDITEIENGLDDNCNGITDECNSNTDCNGVCVDGICVEDSDSFAYEFSKFYFNHDLTNKDIPYSFFRPKQSLGTTNEKFPLIIALHGAEYMGQEEDFFLTNETWGYFALAWIEEGNQKKYPAYVVAPHLSKSIRKQDIRYDLWSTETSLNGIEQLLDSLVSQHNIDKNRVYLTGHSVGGDGTWFIGVKLMHKIAAIVPLSSVIVPKTLDYVREKIQTDQLKNFPIWSFTHQRDVAPQLQTLFKDIENKHDKPIYTHTFNSEIYNLSEDQINQKITNGNIHFYTEYNYQCNYCHFSMTKALREPFLFNWLFKQRKN